MKVWIGTIDYCWKSKFNKFYIKDILQDPFFPYNLASTFWITFHQTCPTKTIFFPIIIKKYRYNFNITRLGITISLVSYFLKYWSIGANKVTEDRCFYFYQNVCILNFWNEKVNFFLSNFCFYIFLMNFKYPKLRI